MEYEEISDIIDEMKADGWTINDYDIHFLIGFSKYVMRKSNIISTKEAKALLIECCSAIYCEDGTLKGKTPSELFKWIHTAPPKDRLILREEKKYKGLFPTYYIETSDCWDVNGYGMTEEYFTPNKWAEILEE